MPEPHLDDASDLLAARLRDTRRRLVLAESCTGGLLAATLAQIPGISEALCGSAVVYRNATKSAWLGIDPQLLDDPDLGPVSAEVTRALALAVLDRTPEADLSAAITGHLGPNAPPGLDGVIYFAIAVREPASRIVREERLELPASSIHPAATRAERQNVATELVLLAIAQVLDSL